MNNDAEFMDWLHIKVHAMRMLPDYKPTVIEFDINKAVAEYFSIECPECKERFDRLKYAVPENKGGFLKGLFK